jgi:hypothetical protein
MSDETPDFKPLRIPDLPDWRPGVVFWKPLDDGNEVCVYPTVTGGGLVCKGPLADQFGYDESWMYGALVDAREAAMEWDGESDPPGKWLRAEGPDEHGKHYTRRHGEPKKGDSFQIEEGDRVQTFQVWGAPMPEEYVVNRVLPNGNLMEVSGVHDLQAPNGVIRVNDVVVGPPAPGGIGHFGTADHNAEEVGELANFINRTTDGM